MDRTHVDHAIATADHPHDLWKLVRKLRWIGLEDEARRLQLAMSSVSGEPGGTIPIETFCTD
jgi:hypothetical protein